MIIHTPRNRLCPLVLTGLALLLEVRLPAQTVAPAVDKGTQSEESVMLEKFVVTGSAVPVAEGRSFQPVTKFTNEDMADLGAVTIVEGLRSMPSFFGEMSTELRSNGGTGSAGVNLRGLGGTLTLLDGHRTAGFDEINLIPMIAFDRMEIVKDGAGARYGADALSGVFNTMLVPSFQGTKLQAFYGNTTNEDAGTLRFGAMVGAKRGRTDIVVAAESYHRNALMARDREVSADSDGRSRGGVNRRDSQVSSLILGARPGDPTWLYLVLPQGQSVATVAANYEPFDVVPATSMQFYNQRATTASIPEQENKSVYARINQQVIAGGVLDAYARILFAQNRYESAVLTNSFQISRGVLNSSPHRPTSLLLFPTTDATIIGYLHPDSIGPRGRFYERDVYDFQFGLKGRLGGSWSWDATYVYSWWYRDDLQTNSLHSANLRAAITSGAYNPFALDSAAGVNPNNGRSYDNPAALRSVTTSGRIDRDFGVRGGDARFNGALARLPGGALELAGGADYYIVEQSIVPDAIIPATTTYTGFNSTQFSASGYTSQGLFAELVVPVFGKGLNFPMARALSLSLNVRRSEKEINGTVRDTAGVIGIRERTFKETTPKFGLLYVPFDDLRVRSTYAEGFRTPGLSSLFAAQSTFNAGLSDPLGFPIASTVPVTGRGNPDLEAERSKTWNVGVTFTPQVVKGLQLDVDYYSSRIENLVADGAQLIIDVNAANQGSGFVRGNASTINPDAKFAGQITRNAFGTILGVTSSPTNVASREATGLDYAISYTLSTIGGSRWVSRLAANSTLSWDLSTAQDLPSRNWLGRFVDVGVNSISPGSIPRHRGNFSQTWEKSGWLIRGAVNYVSHLEDDITRTYLNRFRHIGSWTTIDAQVGYTFKTSHPVMRGVEVRMGVSNLFDRAAPYAAGAFNDGYDMTTHSNRGRFIYTQVTKTF